MVKPMTLLQMRDAIAKAIADSVGHGMREKCERQADAVLKVVAPQLLATADDATLRQQAGRVDEGMARRLCAKFEELGYGYPDTDDAKLAIQAALAQNTQGCPKGSSAVEVNLLLQAERARVPADSTPVPLMALHETLQVLKNVDTQLRATGQPSARIERLINFLSPIAAAPSQRAEVK